MSKKHMVFNTIFSRLFMVLASENDSKIRKNISQKSIFASILAPKTLPKSIQNRKKSKKNAFEKKLKKRGYAPQAPDPGNHRENPLGAPAGPSNYKYIN